MADPIWQSSPELAITRQVFEKKEIEKPLKIAFLTMFEKL